MGSVNSLQLNGYGMNLSFSNQELTSNTSVENTPLKVENNLSDKGESINDAAINLSISMQSMLVYMNVRSLEYVQQNTEAQQMLNNMSTNEKIFSIFGDVSFDLEALGYEGKPLEELTQEEAKQLISEEGFFGVEQTSDRVSSFVFNLTEDNVEFLKEAREGLVKGFEEAEKLFGGELPEISYETQKRTLDLVDKRIEELS